MHFKKIVYVITTAIAVFACLGSGAKAKPMQEIFDDIAVKDPGMQVCAHIEKLKKYIHDKAPEPRSSWYQLDPISKIKRKDSVIFGLFCCFCYKKNWANHVRFAAERRTMFERNEDIDVIMSIFPMCIEGPEGLAALCRKLEINIDDIMMTEDGRLQLIDFIKAIPTYETRTEKVDLPKPQGKVTAEKTESHTDFTDDTEGQGTADKSVVLISPKK